MNAKASAATGWREMRKGNQSLHEVPACEFLDLLEERLDQRAAKKKAQLDELKQMGSELQERGKQGADRDFDAGCAAAYGDVVELFNVKGMWRPVAVTEANIEMSLRARIVAALDRAAEQLELRAKGAYEAMERNRKLQEEVETLKAAQTAQGQAVLRGDGAWVRDGEVVGWSTQRVASWPAQYEREIARLVAEKASEIAEKNKEILELKAKLDDALQPHTSAWRDGVAHACAYVLRTIQGDNRVLEGAPYDPALIEVCRKVQKLRARWDARTLLNIVDDVSWESLARALGFQGDLSAPSASQIVKAAEAKKAELDAVHADLGEKVDELALREKDLAYWTESAKELEWKLKAVLKESRDNEEALRNELALARKLARSPT